MNSRLTHISKEISYALRHHPEEYGLALDAQGFVEIADLLWTVRCSTGGAVRTLSRSTVTTFS